VAQDLVWPRIFSENRVALFGMRPGPVLAPGRARPYGKAADQHASGPAMHTAHLWIAIGAGGALGAMARHGVSIAAMRALGPNFPWGTLGVNVIGSFVMGLFIAWLVLREPHPTLLRAFVAVGVLGGFTTFSAFALEAVTLWRDRSLNVAALYVLASVMLSIGALMAGLSAGKALT